MTEKKDNELEKYVWTENCAIVKLRTLLMLRELLSEDEYMIMTGESKNVSHHQNNLKQLLKK